MQNITVFSGDLYNVTETFTYNSQLQLTNINAPNMNWTYTFSATQNNGQITQAHEATNNETLTYTYDSLKRLTQASSNGLFGVGAWSQGYAYDGFGNLTDKNVLSGSAQPLHVTVNAATNRITGYTYDSNGNLTAIPSSMTATFDIENRMVSGTDSNGTVTYVYGPDNERVWYGNTTTGTAVYYGAKGEKLGEIPASGSATTLHQLRGAHDCQDRRDDRQRVQCFPESAGEHGHCRRRSALGAVW
jgi:YD repeat-containing protein